MATPPPADWAQNAIAVLQAGAPVVTGFFALAGAWVGQHVAHRKKYGEFVWGRAMDSLGEIHDAHLALMHACLNDEDSKLYIPMQGTTLTESRIYMLAYQLHMQLERSVQDLWTLVFHDEIVPKLKAYLDASRDCGSELAHKKVSLLGTTDEMSYRTVNSEAMHLFEPVDETYTELRSALALHLRVASRRTIRGRLANPFRRKP